MLAAYRVGDSPVNVVTPLMAYFPLIVVFVQRYKKDAGIGSVVALMLPYVVVLTVAWTLFFVAWYLIGIPLGPGRRSTPGDDLPRSVGRRDERLDDHVPRPRHGGRRLRLGSPPHAGSLLVLTASPVNVIDGDDAEWCGGVARRRDWPTWSETRARG